MIQKIFAIAAYATLGTVTTLLTGGFAVIFGMGIMKNASTPVDNGSQHALAGFAIIVGVALMGGCIALCLKCATGSIAAITNIIKENDKEPEGEQHGPGK